MELNVKPQHLSPTLDKSHMHYILIGLPFIPYHTLKVKNLGASALLLQRDNPHSYVKYFKAHV